MGGHKNKITGARCACMEVCNESISYKLSKVFQRIKGWGGGNPGRVHGDGPCGYNLSKSL